MPEAEFRVAEELHRFLKPAMRTPSFRKAVGPTDTIKHTVESLGIPHTEVGEYRIDGHVVDDTAVITSGEVVEVRPPSGPVHVKDPRFVLDGHLGRLAAYLRMLGFDCWYARVADDQQLARVAASEDRILLTRDVGLLKRREIQRGYCPRSDQPNLQLREVVGRYALADRIRPFQRCMECNGELLPVPKDEVAALVPPHTRATKDVFSRCAECRKIYWRGSHYERMTSWIRDLRSAGEAPETEYLSERDVDVQRSEPTDSPAEP